ncbi:MAG: hypothetical protein HEQ22_07905 [Sphingopyxis sp.]|uniref:hypothetical protein n=1 Tax=Sphingopyxis sp. TaxID=1908224 RepID=UPI003D80BF25
MSALLTVPSRWHELSDFAFGGVLFLLAISSLFRPDAMNTAEVLVASGGLAVAIILLVRAARARRRRIVRSKEVQRLQNTISNALDF